MEHLLETFFEIDKEHRKFITKQDLIKYAEANDYEESMPETWMSLFDPKNTGQITLDAFCNKLGLSPESDRIKEWKQSVQEVETEPTAVPLVTAAPVPDAAVGDKNTLSDLNVVFAQMSEPMKANIYEMTRSLLQNEPKSEPIDAADVTRQLKTKLDEQYGATWNVAIVKGSYWITHTHREQMTFHFRMGQQTILAWQSAPPRKLQKQ